MIINSERILNITTIITTTKLVKKQALDMTSLDSSRLIRELKPHITLRRI